MRLAVFLFGDLGVALNLSELDTRESEADCSIMRWALAVHDEDKCLPRECWPLHREVKPVPSRSAFIHLFELWYLCLQLNLLIHLDVLSLIPSTGGLGPEVGREQMEHLPIESLDVVGAIVARIGPLSNFLKPRQSNMVSQAEGVISSLHYDKVRDFVSKGEPVQFILPAFPAKSPNPEKTHGAEPDLGEVLALQALQSLCDDIEKLHTPGARVLICSDGRVFSDLVGVSDEQVSVYTRGIESIIAEFGLSHLDTFHLENVFTENSFSEMRQVLTERYGQSIEDIRLEIETDESMRWMFNGIHRFIFEDRLPNCVGQSREYVRREAKTVAYQMIQRSNAWSRLVEAQFPRAVRLSIHPQLPESKKIGVQLVPSENIWRTPWHSVALKKRDDFCLVRRRDAELMGARLQRYQDRYAYYTLDATLGVDHVAR